MAALIHSDSEHVSFRASEHVLGMSGIVAKQAPQVSVKVEMKAGRVIDLREPGQPAAKIVSGVATVIESNAAVLNESGD